MNNTSFAIDKKADVTLILLDISTSMNKIETYDKEAISRFEMAKKSIKEILKTFTYSDKVGLRTIGISQQKLIDKYTKNPEQVNSLIIASNNSFFKFHRSVCNQSELIIPIEGGTHSQVYDVLNIIKDDGSSTPIEYTIKQAVEVDLAYYPSYLKKHIILITDGYEGCGGNPCKYIEDLVTNRKDITIDVISVLPVGANFSLYNCIASPTGGKVYNPVKTNEYSPISFKPASPSCTNCQNAYKKVNYNTLPIEYRTYLLQFE